MKNFTLEEHAQSLADYLPNGCMFEAKNIYNSNFRQLIRGLAGELFTAQGYLITLDEEYFPDATNLFLSEWEQALGIPDDCLTGTGTNNERRIAILIKLVGMAVQTAEDFEALAALFGLTVIVRPGTEVFPFPIEFPIVFFNSPGDIRYVIVVDFTDPPNAFFPYAFPIVFGDPAQQVLKCLFDKVRPANTQIIYRSI